MLWKRKLWDLRYDYLDNRQPPSVFALLWVDDLNKSISAEGHIFYGLFSGFESD
jgi:hypothetical protein